jgi:hypothetical protein
MKSINCCQTGQTSITCSNISNIPSNLTFTKKFNDSSLLFTIISWYYLNLSNEYVGDVIILTHVIKYKKSLEIPKGQSEPVNRRRTYNTMAKRKKHKRTNNDLQRSTKHTHNTKDRVTRTPLKIGRVISPSHICVGSCFLFCPFSFGYRVVCCEFEPRS